MHPSCPPPKLDCGFEHDDTGHLLCPIEYNWEDATWVPTVHIQRQYADVVLSIWTHICDSHPDYVVTTDSWPAFLYPKVNSDIHNIEQGFLHGGILLKVHSQPFHWGCNVHHLPHRLSNLSSPCQPLHKTSSARRTWRNICCQPGNALNRIKRHQLKDMSPIYSVWKLYRLNHLPISLLPSDGWTKNLQLHFALSNVNTWNENDGCFNYTTFYNNIIDYFKVDLGPENKVNTDMLLSWWTRSVWHLSSRWK